MSKLTEIKNTIDNIKNNGDGFFEDFASCFPNDERAILIENAKPWLEYLLFLVEEQNKALEFYADENRTFEEISDDGGFIARKALNTSSNTKGEI